MSGDEGKRRWGVDWGAVLAGGPAVLIVGVCSVLPLLWMVVVLVRNPEVRGEFKITAFRSELLGRTLGYNALVAVIATAMGLPAAFVLGRGRGWVARMMWVLLPAALIMPSLSYAYGWSQIVRGLRQTWVMRELGYNFRPNGPGDIFRCIWSLGTWLWAVPAVLIGLSLRRMDTGVQQQALLEGALRRVTLRQLVGPIIASMAIVTILATQEFSVYEPTGISVVATEVRMVFDTGALSSDVNPVTVSGFLGAGYHSPDQAGRAAAAVATATPMLVVTVLLAVVAAWGVGRMESGDEVTVGSWPRVLDASRWVVWGTVGLLFLNVGVPVWSLIGSLRVKFDVMRMWGEFGPQAQGAMIVGCEAAGVALLLAMFSAARWTRGMLAVAGASFLVGGQLLAIGIIRIYNRPGLFWAYNTSVVAVVAYLGRFGWLAVGAGRGTWSRAWKELREMGAVDGASGLRAAWEIVWPVAWPGLLAGAMLVGALSLTEVPATVLLMPQNPQVLTPTLMTWIHMSRYDPMIEASLVMMGMVVAPAVVGVLLAGLGRGVRRWV